MNRLRVRRRIDGFLRELAAFPDSDRIFNPYTDAAMRRNLRFYLRYFTKQKRIPLLLVGEALGYRGGALTGIPFSSCALFQHGSHPMLRELGPRLILRDDSAETTASIVWQSFSELEISPLCWNAFPFHPHKPGDRASNRAPTVTEQRATQQYLQTLVLMFEPERVVGVGNRGYACAVEALPDMTIDKLRHPSRGGKQAFQEGLRALRRRRKKRSR